jgi:hypothetical protein
MPIQLDTKAKLLRHFDRVKGIIEGKYLPPLMVDIDVYEGPCNLDCIWCSQAVTRNRTDRAIMPVETMERLGLFSQKWGIKAWKIAGLSEPTLNPNLDVLLQSGHVHGIDMGLTTNGLLLDRIINLNLLTWVGISLDATTAKTWSLLKKSPEKNFLRIIDNINFLRDKCPDLDISIKYCRWSSTTHPHKNRFYPGLQPFEKARKDTIRKIDNYADAERLPELANKLGCNHILRDAFPENFPSLYKFDKCLATPLEGVFGADHKFHLCCDARNVYVLTDNYTRNNWEELPSLWSSKKHRELIKTIDPKKCLGCSKWKLCSVFENVVLDGKYTKDYQVNFI